MGDDADVAVTMMNGRRWTGFVGAAGGLVSVLTLAGCPGTLDLAMFETGTGGSTGTGGGPTGGATGAGGTTFDCTGGNDGASIVTTNCATSFCHIPGAANDGVSGGLDLTVDANIGARLVDVQSVGTADNRSRCIGNGPYLLGESTPAMGLLIDKLKTTRPCGDQMPADALPLTTTQQNCLIQWATTLTSP